MRISELELPKTPEQQRLEQLRANSKRASDALKLERNRQKMQRAQKAMQALSAPAIKKTSILRLTKKKPTRMSVMHG